LGVGKFARHAVESSDMSEFRPHPPEFPDASVKAVAAQ